MCMPGKYNGFVFTLNIELSFVNFSDFRMKMPSLAADCILIHTGSTFA